MSSLQLAHTHACFVLTLTTKSASKHAHTIPAFEVSFLQFNPDVHGRLEMSEKDIKHISAVHILLTTALDDITTTDEHLESLKKKLSNKNLKALKFVCEDLKLLPILSEPQSAPIRITRLMYAEYLTTWVCFSLFSSDLH